jgi:hypothetical protein
MKTKMMKRAAAFAASVLMTAAMAVPAFAVDTNILYPTSPIVTDDTSSDNNKVAVPKKLYLYNVDGAAIYAPGVTYTYTVSSGEDLANKKISSKSMTHTASGYAVGADNVFAFTKQGPATGIKLGSGDSSTVGTTSGQTATLNFGTAKHAAYKEAQDPADGNAITKYLYIETDVDQFKDPGVYRYKIELTGNTREATGVDDWEKKLTSQEEHKDAEIYYLDVYVSELPTTEEEQQEPGVDTTKRDVYGMVLFKADNEAITYQGSTDEAKKINTLEPDEYHTYNLQVEKEITGMMSDPDQKFEFTINLSNENVTSTQFDAATTGSDLSPATNPAALSSGKATVSAKLSHGKTLSITGLPKDTKATINEKNLAAEPYTVSVNTSNTEKTNNGATGTPFQFSPETNNYNIVNEYEINKTEMGDKILITNNLDAISPTGILFRIAPYALMMTAGGVLIAVYLRGKKRDDAESMI